MSLNQKTRSVTLNRECFSLQVLHYLTVVVCFVTEKSMSVKSFKLSCPIVTQVSHPLFSHTHSHSLYTEAPPDASHKATRVWNPLQGLSPEEEDTVDGFLELACSPVMPHAGRNKEFALHTLYQTKGSIKVRLVFFLDLHRDGIIVGRLIFAIVRSLAGSSCRRLSSFYTLF